MCKNDVGDFTLMEVGTCKKEEGGNLICESQVVGEKKRRRRENCLVLCGEGKKEVKLVSYFHFCNVGCIYIRTVYTCIFRVALLLRVYLGYLSLKTGLFTNHGKVF
jgi:hypothetical protein